MQRFLILANPISGGGKARMLAPALATALREHGIEATVHLTQAAGDAAARARTAASEGFTGLVAVGGDGTVNEVLNGMADPSMPLAVLPVGTANVLALELGLPRDPVQLARLVASGSTRQLAIGLAAGRRFLLFCGIGLDGAVVQRLSQVRSGTLGKHKWLGPILHTVLHWPRFDLSVAFDDGTRLDGVGTVLVTRVRNYGGIAAMPRGIDLGDGRLHVLCFRPRSRLAWIWLGFLAILRLLRPGRWLVHRTAQTITVSGSAPYQIDGDHGGAAPLRVELAPAQATVFAPQPRR